MKLLMMFRRNLRDLDFGVVFDAVNRRLFKCKQPVSAHSAYFSPIQPGLAAGGVGSKPWLQVMLEDDKALLAG